MRPVGEKESGTLGGEASMEGSISELHSQWSPPEDGSPLRGGKGGGFGLPGGLGPEGGLLRVQVP